MAQVASGQITLTDLNDSKQLVMYIGASQSRTVIFNGVSTYAPNYASTNQILTPQLFIAGTTTDVSAQSTSTKWFVQVNGSGTPTEITATTTDYTLGVGAPKTLTLKTNLLTSNTSMTYICEMQYPDPSTGFTVTAKAEIEIVKVTNGTNGANAITAVLTNDADSVGADSSGGSQIITGVSSTITVYEGATDVTSLWSMGTPVVTGLGALNTAYTLTGAPANRTFTLTGTNPMTADVATVTWTLTRSGYSSITKMFTINRIRNGVAGTSPTIYRLIPSTNAFQQNISGVFTPTTLTVTGKSQTGTGAYGNYAGKFMIFESTDGTNFGTAKYTTGATDESSKVYTPSATNVKAIKVQMYLAGGTTTLLDEQIIPVVKDGATGAVGNDSLYANVWTPDGNTVRNSQGSLTVEVDLFKGAGQVTPSAFKWYIQDPTATTASGGDTDGGDGWRLLTSTYNVGITGYTADKITVPASAIAGVESFKSVVTYSSAKYSGVATVIDVSDPIMVRIDGINVFKNGQGTTTLTATLLRNGEVLSPTGYTFAWSIYNASNVKTAFTASTQTITVNASDVAGKANVVCEVSK
jgi:hypothetical protein